MKISCMQENLKRGLGLVSHLASKNANLPILNNVLLKTEEGSLLLSATNLEIGIQCRVRAKIEHQGSFTLPASLLNNYISLLNEDRVNLELIGQELNIITAKQKSKIKGEGASEFPIIPEVERNKEYQVKKEELQEALSQVVFAASLDEMRPEISGLLFDFSAGELTLAATDSYRLAEKKVKLAKGLGGDKIIVPQASLMELLRVLSGVEKEMISIFVAENQILFSGGEIELVSRLIEGNFPDYQQILPKNFKTTLQANKNELTQAIKGVSLFSKSGINDINVHLSVTNQEITLSAANAQLGENITKLKAEIKGESNDIVFNYQYLLDGLGQLSGEEIIFEMIDNANPGLFRTAEEKRDYVYIIMPIKQ